MLLTTLFQTRFKILHCYRMSNNPEIYIKVSFFLSLNISMHEIGHTVNAMLENLMTTGCVSSMNLKYLITLCHIRFSINVNVIILVKYLI